MATHHIRTRRILLSFPRSVFSLTGAHWWCRFVWARVAGRPILGLVPFRNQGYWWCPSKNNSLALRILKMFDENPPRQLSRDKVGFLSTERAFVFSSSWWWYNLTFELFFSFFVFCFACCFPPAVNYCVLLTPLLFMTHSHTTFAISLCSCVCACVSCKTQPYPQTYPCAVYFCAPSSCVVDRALAVKVVCACLNKVFRSAVRKWDYLFNFCCASLAQLVYSLI